MTFPQLARFTDVALLFLRLMVGVVFFASGYGDLKTPQRATRTLKRARPSRFFWARRKSSARWG
jgi:uncharacterized membrane protein YphA (DoxX/SURF4 family)